MQIELIREAINRNQYKVTDHADEEAAADNLTLDEIVKSVMTGEIIEDYPDDFPYPSCLIFGQNKNNDAIHSVWAYNDPSQWAVLITVYRPDSELWIDWKRRISDE